MSRVGVGFRPSAVVAALGLLAGCSMVGSVSIDAIPGMVPAGPGCNTTLGSYVLPKQVLAFTITESDAGASHQITRPTLKTTADDPERFSFCLDHLENPLSDDRVIVQYASLGQVSKPDAGSGQSGDATQRKPIRTSFLETIAANGEDRSVIIVRKVIQAVFNILSQTGLRLRSTTLGPRASNVVASHEVDPLDPGALAEVNAAVRRFGFCLMVEDLTFDRKAATVDEFCNRPQQIALSNPSPRMEVLARQTYFAGAKPTTGVFYRPKRPYGLYIFTKDDPEGPGPWRLSLIEEIELNNLSPVISVGVDRALFTDQRTALVFDAGTLKNVCIGRAGQLASLIDIPLDIIYGIVQLPGERLRVAANSAGVSQQLLETQNNLFQLQQAYIDYLANPDASMADTSTIDASKAGTLQIGSLAESHNIYTNGENKAFVGDPVANIDGNNTEKLFGAGVFEGICQTSDELRIEASTLGTGGSADR
ncbi:MULTISPECIES: hypothetical protein [Aurantimonas]|uniref:hypothetical protein n=1 Tax=Aurantimonas TaxID=182269 RepID=UPI003517D6DC